MNERIQELLTEIRRLEDELSDEMQAQRTELLYWFEGRRVRFEQSLRATHAELRTGVLRWLRASQPRNLVSAPFIYAMIVPFALLDLAVTLYQGVCFRLYGMRRVARERYVVIDRHQLGYLNALERLNCVYCGYANGVIAYAREVAARTEQYWCPIKHARKVLDPHRRYARFADFGDFEDYPERMNALREALRNERGPREPR